MSEIPTDRDLATIAKAIGNGWEMLAAFLSIDQPKVEDKNGESPFHCRTSLPVTSSMEKDPGKRGIV